MTNTMELCNPEHGISCKCVLPYLPVLRSLREKVCVGQALFFFFFLLFSSLYFPMDVHRRKKKKKKKPRQTCTGLATCFSSPCRKSKPYQRAFFFYSLPPIFLTAGKGGRMRRGRAHPRTKNDCSPKNTTDRPPEPVRHPTTTYARLPPPTQPNPHQNTTRSRLSVSSCVIEEKVTFSVVVV